MLKIQSTFEPACNEVWIKNSSDDSKFWLVQAIQPGVRYHIKHSGDFLYKVSNEEDKTNFKVSRIKLPDQVRVKNVELAELQREETLQKVDKLSRLSQKHELAPISDFLAERSDELMPLKNQVTGLSETFYDPDKSEVVYGVEVFRNFMAVLVEKNGRRLLRSISLKTGKVTTHYFDSAFEVNAVDSQISEFFDVSLLDNYSFDSHEVRYKLTTPVAPVKTMQFNMATK